MLSRKSQRSRSANDAAKIQSHLASFLWYRLFGLVMIFDIDGNGINDALVNVFDGSATHVGNILLGGVDFGAGSELIDYSIANVTIV